MLFTIIPRDSLVKLIASTCRVFRPNTFSVNRLPNRKSAVSRIVAFNYLRRYYYPLERLMLFMTHGGFTSGPGKIEAFI